MTRAGNWPGGLRWIARRVKPSRRQARNLTAYEKGTGWRYGITCTNVPDDGIPGVPGSHHAQYIDVVHREHAVVETGGVRTAKAMGLRNLQNLAGQRRLGPRREHRRRPHRLTGRVDRCWDVVPPPAGEHCSIRSPMVLPLAADWIRRCDREC